MTNKDKQTQKRIHTRRHEHHPRTPPRKNKHHASRIACSEPQHGSRREYKRSINKETYIRWAASDKRLIACEQLYGKFTILRSGRGGQVAVISSMGDYYSEAFTELHAQGL